MLSTQACVRRVLGSGAHFKRQLNRKGCKSYTIGAAVAGKDLDFSITETRSHIKYSWKNGEWNTGELVQSPYVNLHVNSNVFHYGQALFEGLKVFHGKDGKVRALNPPANAKRMNLGCRRLCIPEIPVEIFLEAIDRVVKDNADFIPQYGNQQTLYIRPNIFGHGPQIGLKPAPEYHFIVSVHPVGNYFKHGITPAQAKVVTEFDRAARHGTGDVKAAGNYAADMLPSSLHHGEGYALGLYLDSNREYLEEFGTSNFVAIDHEGSFITPDSGSVLKSVTNHMMQELAEHRGLKVSRRKIHVNELPELRSAGGCGTAVVFQPISQITFDGKIFQYDDEAHETLLGLAGDVTRIGFGEKEDEFGWTHEVQL